MVIRSDTGFIGKIYLCTQFFGSFFDLRKNRAVPFGNFFRILLVGAVQGFLRGEAQLPQKTAHRTDAQFDAEFFLDYISDHTAGPQGKGQLQLLRILVPDCIVNPGNMAAVEFAGPSALLAGTQGVPAAATVSGKPVIDTGSGKPQGLNDLFGAFPILDTLNRSDADLFHRFRAYFSSVLCIHGM
ncbi:hypothetical protein HNR65_003613 [Desulfosalsimonas propionicica]|uniref:Uncharacterized protein n=1 Tax=Desulfosalsimonas propionicica TaxID=332175 RepID=A0A7W0HMN4_9BACT|nr:hypothetical protein [Desulfosalsimonas propionicica]